MANFSTRYIRKKNTNGIGSRMTKMKRTPGGGHIIPAPDKTGDMIAVPRLTLGGQHMHRVLTKKKHEPKTGSITKNGNHVVIHGPNGRQDFTMPRADRGAIITNHKGGHSPAVSTGKRHFQHEIIRKKKGTSVGGQFAVDPNGPASKARQAQLLGKHPEDVAKADFKRRKKEAMDRFLAKQKVEREAAHAQGLPGPVTMKRMAKLNGVMPGQLRNKLRKLERIAHAQHREGINTILNNNPAANPEKIGKIARAAGNIKPPKPKSGDIQGTGLAKRIWHNGGWEVPGPKSGDRQVDTTAHHDKVFHGGQWVKQKGPQTLRLEKHQRHVEERAKKDKSEFRRGKNIAAKRHNMKVKGLDFQTPANPVVDALDTSGKFKAVGKRNARGHNMFDKKGNLKVTWKLIPTELRGRQQPSAIKALHNHGHGWEVNKVELPKSETKVHTSTNGMIVKEYPIGEQNDKGIFDSARVKIEGSGDGILKTNGYGGGEMYGLTNGFAYREVGTYKIDQMLGLNVVPKTEEFIDNVNPLNKDHGPYHSIQHFIPNATMGMKVRNDQDFYDHMVDKSEVTKTLFLDTLLGNTDRHGQNWIVADGHYYAIDNGLQMATAENDPREVASGWRCSMKDVVSKRDPVTGRRVYPLSREYQTKLQKILADGSLEREVKNIADHTKPPKYAARYAEATMNRARNLAAASWDKIFFEPGHLA